LVLQQGEIWICVSPLRVFCLRVLKVQQV
jgi:hypothetical protein